MAYEAQQCLKISLEAASDLRAKQYYFVKVAGAGTCDVIGGLTETPIGVLQNKPNTGEMAEIVVVGVTKLNADAGITAGELVGPSADGQADAKGATFAAVTNRVVGVALSTVSNAGEILTAVINCPLSCASDA